MPSPSRAVTVVPPPGALSITRRPWPSSANDRMAAIPDSNISSSGRKPTPSSAMATSTTGPSARTDTSSEAARAWRQTLRTASCTIRSTSVSVVRSSSTSSATRTCGLGPRRSR